MTVGYPTAQTSEVRPKLVWVWVGIGLMVVAAIAFFGLLIASAASLPSRIDDLVEIDPGTSVTAEFVPGTYRVYTENGIAVVPELTVTGESGEVPLVPTASVENYDYDTRHGVSASEFEITTAGTYDVSNTGRLPVLIGPSVMDGVFKQVGLGFLIGSILGITGVVMLIVTLVKRSRSKSRMNPPYPPAGQFPGGYPTQPGANMGYPPQGPVPGYQPQWPGTGYPVPQPQPQQSPPPPPSPSPQSPPPPPPPSHM